jgi:hypothetical protein
MQLQTNAQQCAGSLVALNQFIFAKAVLRRLLTNNCPKPLVNDPTQETGLALLGRGMKREYGPIHYLTRVSFWRAFGICSAKQEIYEAVLSQVEIDLDAVSQWFLRPRLRL